MPSDRNLILTVCTGNICRSPMAAKLLDHAIRAADSGLEQFTVVSAGVAAANGLPASENSIHAMRPLSLDLSAHRSQMLTQDLVGRAHVIFGMTRSHLEMIQYSFKDLPPRLHLFRDFLDPGEPREIPDPYGMGIKDYKAALDSMIEAVPSVLTYLKQSISE